MTTCPYCKTNLYELDTPNGGKMYVNYLVRSMDTSTPDKPHVGYDRALQRVEGTLVPMQDVEKRIKAGEKFTRVWLVHQTYCPYREALAPKAAPPEPPQPVKIVQPDLF